jgi:pimeloyl-ACP methyl ester carboxylesterase
MTRGRKIALAIAGLLAIALTFNTISVSNQTEGAAADPGGRVLRLPGPDLQVREEGPRDGQPMVLLHCFSCSIEWWDEITPELARRNRVIEIDLVGHGGSEKPESGYAIREQANQVALALGRLEVQGAVVVGHSLGGSVATALAETHSELVDRLVIIDTPPSDKASKGLGLTASLGFVPVIGQLLNRVTPDAMVRNGVDVAFAKGYDVPDFAVRSFRDMTYPAYDKSPGESERYRDRKPLHTRLTDTGVPLLVILGDRERIVKVKEASELYREVPGARVSIVPGAGHSPNVEKPRQTARLILEFAREAGDEEQGSEAIPPSADHRDRR